MTDSIGITWHFRPSSAADVPLIEDICADLSNGHDYVPYSWPFWAQDERNQLFVVEDEAGQPAACYCLRIGLAGPETSWMQGVRVAATFRQRGLAAEMLRHAIQTSRQQDLRVLRYTTAHDNAPMHRLARQFNFRQMGDYTGSYFKREMPLPSTVGLSYRLVTASEFDGAYHLLTNSPEYHLNESFYCDNWWWKPLSMACLREHIERREVFSLTGALKTLAILSKTDDETYCLAFLTGELAASQLLLAHLLKRSEAYAPPDQSSIVSAVIARTTQNIALLEQAGFRPFEDEAAYVMYELPLYTQSDGLF